MINNKKLIYEKTTKITNVMKQTDKILNSYYPNSNLTDAQGLSRAYGNGNGFYIDGDKMYVSRNIWKRNVWRCC